MSRLREELAICQWLGVLSVKTAIVHDWLVTYAGAERVLEQMILCYPEADLFSVVDFLDQGVRGFLCGKKPTTTFIQNLPGARKRYRNYLPLMPLAVEQLDLSSYDLILSSSHAVAKGVIVGPDQVHVCLCYTPVRYAWDLQHQYLRESGLSKGPMSWIVRYLLHRLRIWDLRTIHGVDEFLAISHFIARRIKRTYGRESKIVYPPVDVDAFPLHPLKDSFYLTASRMVPYKRIDLIVEAFGKMPDKRLVVIGDGPDFDKINAKAGSNTTMMGFQPYEVLKQYLSTANAFIFAAEEDFGIAPIEAQATGTPVIAYGKGGALETVVAPGASSHPTGIFFEEQSVDSIINAVKRFEKIRTLFEPEQIRKNAERFSVQRFKEELCHEVEYAVAKARKAQ